MLFLSFKIMSTIIGLITAMIAALGFGSWLVPMKKVKNYEPGYFQLLIAIAIFLSGLIISLFYDVFILSYWGILSGIIWTVASIMVVIAVKKIGLSKLSPISMGFVILTSFLWGVLFFKETFKSILMSIIGIILLTIGLILVSVTKEKRKNKNEFLGIILAILSGIVAGTYLVPFKLSGLDPIHFLFSNSLGILLSGIIFFLITDAKIDKKIIFQGFLSGFIFGVANFASFFAIIYLGLAVGFPLTQIALFISVLWGVLYFKEIKGKNRIFKIILGAIMLFVGIVLLSLSI